MITQQHSSRRRLRPSPCMPPRHPPPRSSPRPPHPRQPTPASTHTGDSSTPSVPSEALRREIDASARLDRTRSCRTRPNHADPPPRRSGTAVAHASCAQSRPNHRRLPFSLSLALASKRPSLPSAVINAKIATVNSHRNNIGNSITIWSYGQPKSN